METSSHVHFMSCSTRHVSLRHRLRPCRSGSCPFQLFLFLLRAHGVTAGATIMRPQGMRRTALGACMQMGQSSAPIAVTLSTLLPHPLEWRAQQGSLCSVHAGTTPRNTWRGHHLRRNSRRHMLLCACMSFETNSQHSLSTLLLLLILHRRSSPSKCTKWRATSANDIKGRGRGSLSL